jgi:hypothetical protein
MRQAMSPPTSSLLQLTFYICSPSEMWGVWQQLGQPVHAAQHMPPMHAAHHMPPMHAAHHMPPMHAAQHMPPALSAQHRRPMHAVQLEPAMNFVYGTESRGLQPGHSFNK